MLPVIIELCLVGFSPSGQAFGTGYKSERERFIAMDVHKKVYAGIRHRLFGEKNFGR